MAKLIAIGIALILASAWVGTIIGDLHAAYQIRKHERESNRG